MWQHNLQTLTSLGTIHLILGVFWFLCAYGGQLAFDLSLHPSRRPEFTHIHPQSFRQEQPSGLYEFASATVMGAFVLSILMIVGGVGLLYHRHWSRTVCNLYGVLSILYTLVKTFWAVFYVMPAQYAIMEKMPDMNAERMQMINSSDLYCVVEGGVLSLIWPVMMLIFMNNKDMVEPLEQDD
jgi:hypothetical protein